MKQILFIIFCSLYFACGQKEKNSKTVASKLSEITVDTFGLQVKLDAIHDFEADSMRYYFHSIANPLPGLTKKFSALKVAIISRNCLLNTYEQQYNLNMDSIVFKNHHILLSTLNVE